MYESELVVDVTGVEEYGESWGGDDEEEGEEDEEGEDGEEDEREEDEEDEWGEEDEWNGVNVKDEVAWCVFDMDDAGPQYIEDGGVSCLGEEGKVGISGKYWR